MPVIGRFPVRFSAGFLRQFDDFVRVRRQRIVADGDPVRFGFADGPGRPRLASGIDERLLKAAAQKQQCDKKQTSHNASDRSETENFAIITENARTFNT